MNKQYVLVALLIIGISFASCRSKKDLIYLRKVESELLTPEFVASAPEYRIKTDDNLFVSIQSLNPEVNQLYNPAQSVSSQQGSQQLYGQLSGQYINGYLVDSKGNISLPILGNLSVAGLTQEEAQAKVQERADEYLKGASVKVKLLNYKITIMGEVTTPGVYYNYNRSLTLLEAIGMANGTTDYAKIRRVLVMRTTDKQSKTYRLDLSKKDFLQSEAFFLQPNDVVYIEPHRLKNTNSNSAIYSLILSTVSTAALITSIILSND